MRTIDFFLGVKIFLLFVMQACAINNYSQSILYHNYEMALYSRAGYFSSVRIINSKQDYNHKLGALHFEGEAKDYIVADSSFVRAQTFFIPPYWGISRQLLKSKEIEANSPEYFYLHKSRGFLTYKILDSITRMAICKQEAQKIEIVYSLFSNLVVRNTKCRCLELKGCDYRISIDTSNRIDTLRIAEGVVEDISTIKKIPRNIYLKDSIEHLKILTDNNTSLTFAGCIIDNLIIAGKQGAIEFKQCTFLRAPDFTFLINPAKITFDSCDFSHMYGLINLPAIVRDSIKKLDTPSELHISRCDLSKIKFNYCDYITSFTPEQLRTLKKNYEVWGMSDSYELADIILIKAEAGKSWFSRLGIKIQDWWWGFGYHRGYIFRNSFFLFLFFLIANMFIGVRNLNRYGYSIPGLIRILKRVTATQSKWRRILSQFVYTAAYTCFVFWGINLSKDRLRLSRISYLSYIILQYVVGIVCLAYLAGYVIAK